MIITNLKIKGFKKHKEGEWDFLPGSNMIVGPNYSGKTCVMEAILIGLWGNAAAPDTTKELIHDGCKDFSIQLTLSSGMVIKRSSKDSSVARGDSEPFARGHTAVNTAIEEELGMDRVTFTRVFASEQGSPQQLLDMGGSELQRFIESVLGIDKLDLVLKAANKRGSAELNKAEALAYMVLESTDLANATLSVTELQLQLASHEADIADTEAAHKDASVLHTEKLVSLLSISENNAKIASYIATKKQVEASLAETLFIELVSIEPLELRIAELLESVTTMQAFVKTTQQRNNTVAEYSKALAGRPEQDAQDTSELEDKVRIYTQMEATAKLQDVLTSRQAALTLLESRLLEAGEQLPQVDTSKVAQLIEELIGLRDVASHQVAQIKEALDGAECPTCHRAFAAHDQKALAAELASAMATFTGYSISYSEAAHEEASVLQKNREIAAGNGRIAVLETQVAMARQHRDAALADLAAQPEITEGYKEALKAFNITLQKMRADNTLFLAYTQRLSALVKPDWETVSLTDTLVTLTSDEVTLAECRTTLLLTIKGNGYATANNDRRQRTLDTLAELIAPDLKVIDLAPLQKEASLLGVIANDLSVRLGLLVQEQQEARVNLAPLVEQLKIHDLGCRKIAEYHKVAEDCKFISTLLANSRAGFVTKAITTIFGVATEFSKLATGGDIEEVFLGSAGINYKEQQKVRGRKAASGAQKSIMGLGIKLGVANLVTTDFGALLLDEAGAACSDDISLQMSLAMGSFCAQSIAITHRKLDVAGNVIAL